MGLSAVSAPIIIHLLNRRRFRNRPWAAMQFLLESIRKNRRRLKIEELILLVLRCLVLLMLAVGLARFTGCSALETMPGGDGSRTVVFILDDSYSMGQKVAEATLFSHATADLNDKLAKLSETDKVAILLASQPDSPDAGFAPNFADPEALASRVRSFGLSDRRARLAESLAAAREALKDPVAAGRLYVLSDFRRADLDAREQSEAIAREFDALKNMGVEVVAMDYGRKAMNNLTIREIRLLDKFAVAKLPFRIALTVRNNGPELAENVEVVLTALLVGEGDDKTELTEVKLPVRTIREIDPGQSKPLECTIVLPDAGAAVISAKLGSDELLGDNGAHLALEVRRFVKVLIVDGKPNLTDKTDSESFFLFNALDDGKGSYGTLTEVIGVEALPGANFAEYDMVMMLNVAAFPAGVGADGVRSADGDEPLRYVQYPKLRELERYVRSGGGLAVFTGDRVNSRFYRECFYADGEGPFPLPIRSRVGNPRNRDEFFRLDPGSIVSTNVLRCFQGSAADATRVIRFFAFHSSDKASGRPGANAKPPRILARFTDPQNSPAVVAREYGQGSVVAFLSTASMRWTDWPIDGPGTFIAMVNDTVSYLARPDRERFTAGVGEPIVYDIPVSLLDAQATLKTPRYPAEDPIPVVPRAEEHNRLRYERVCDAGVYALKFELPDGSSTAALFARNVDPDEGDLKPGLREGITTAFGSDEFVYERRGPAVLEKTYTLLGNEYWTWALVAVLALMAAEVFLAQRFGHYI